MTVIVAKKEKDKIILACDNQTSYGGYKMETTSSNSSRSKIKKISEDFAIGCAGLVKEITVFQRFCERSKPKSNTENDIYDFMVEFKDYCKKTMDGFSFDSCYIIIYKKKMFEVVYGFDIQEKNHYCALGSGMFEALVVFEMGGNTTKAVEMAKKFDRGCGGDTLEIEIKI